MAKFWKFCRYCVTVNVIGFLYSGFQAIAEVHHRINQKHIISKPLGFYFDFAMDQVSISFFFGHCN